MHSKSSGHKSGILKVANAHFALVAILMLSTIIFDAWKLITPDAVLQRWTIAVFLLVITTAVWYSSRFTSSNKIFNNILGFSLIFSDIIITTILIYSERGMASRSVLLYAIPIIASSILIGSSRAVYATATFATAAYTLAAVRYFVANFNEGYKIELYGMLGLYSAVFFVIAKLVNILMLDERLKN